MTATLSIEVQPLSPALGAEITGVDLGRPLDDESFARIHDAWLDHLVLLFRGQDLSAADQMRFCGYFGKISARARPKELQHEDGDAPFGVMYVSNLTVDGVQTGSLPNGPMQFHSDQCYTERPAMAAVLYAIEVPPVGGNTLFANQYKAYDAVPEDLKARLEGRRVFNIYKYDNTAWDKVEAGEAGSRSCWQPVFRTHPETGKRALYINRLMTSAIEGLDQIEAADALQTLADISERADLVYEHVWRKGDLLIWDNRCTLHGRTDFDPAHRRHLRRFTVEGTKPV